MDWGVGQEQGGRGVDTVGLCLAHLAALWPYQCTRVGGWESSLFTWQQPWKNAKCTDAAQHTTRALASTDDLSAKP